MSGYVMFSYFILIIIILAYFQVCMIASGLTVY